MKRNERSIMKHKSMSQMNKERKPMTVEEEYRNADVPMPDELKYIDPYYDAPYNGGIAYTEFVKLFKGTNERKTENKD